MTAFDPELNVSVFRNLGKVDKYGLDGYLSYQPVKAINRGCRMPCVRRTRRATS